MQKLFTKLIELLDNKQDAMIVTIIDEAGSSPRGRGSQMLVAASGQLLGTIGGGSVEKTSEQLGLELLQTRKSGIHHYELRKNVKEDIGMECGGDVTVHFQFVDASIEAWKDLASEIVDRIENKTKAYLTLSLDGEIPTLTDEEADDNKHFSMSLPIGERAILFGGGHVCKALAPILSSVGFRITVMDEREEFVTTERFPMAEERIVGDYTKIGDYLDIKPDDYIVVMTNGHTHDYDVEEYVLRRETAYVGVIGSAKKTASVNERLREAGVSEDMINYVHTPIGIDIKATTPEEIAISVTGEMVLVRATLRNDGDEVKRCPMSM